ncbi:MAG: hypothetical protein HND56_01725 [Pseudomonadota bacterium]|jgi:hypothetical protein|nr:hypothetical protein [Pseudomonadota bacterium]QKK04482.1 MAG: hypothetical protein HND56_01725 [Pseudomonadota bacterium]
MSLRRKNKTSVFRTGLVCAAALTVFLAGAPVFADGMPPGYTEEMTPLDRALMDINGIEPDGDNTPVPLTPQEKKVEPVQATPPAPEADATAEKAPVPQTAAPENRIVQVQEGTSFFGLSLGVYDAFTNGQLAGAFNFEFQPGVRIIGKLQPIFGAMLASNGAMFGYAGVGLPLDMTEKIFFMPSLAVGAYKDGAGVDLKKTIAYRLGAEIGTKLANGARLSLDAHMITNGRSLNHNDRTEFIGIKYTMPLQNFGKKKKQKLERPY